MSNRKQHFPKLLFFVQIFSGVVTTFVILWLYMNENVKVTSLSLRDAHDQHLSDDDLNLNIVEPGLFQCRSSSNKIAMMKTHKCGTTTIQGILLRHAYKLDLNVALMHNYYRFSTTELFNRSELLKTPWAVLPMDMITEHIRWNYNEVMALLGPEAMTFTILRDPVDQFESFFSSIQLNFTYGVNLSDLISSIRNNSSAKYDVMRQEGYLGRNQMAYDLGLSPSLFHDEQAVNQLITQLEKELHLVLITERMEESLILLRHLLCLSIEDVTSLPMNVRKPELVLDLNPEDRQVLRTWLGVDERIYRHFVRIFDQRVAEFGASRMEEEVRLLRLANQKVWDRCVLRQVANEELKGQYQWVINGTLGYVINRNNKGCDLYAINIIHFLHMFRERMLKKVLRLVQTNGYL